MSYFALKSSKVVSFWGLFLQTPGHPAAGASPPEPHCLGGGRLRPGPSPRLKFLDPPCQCSVSSQIDFLPFHSCNFK